MRRMKKIYLALTTAGILFSFLAFSSDLLAADKSPCAEDIAKFCKNVNPENYGIIRCLEKHEKELSQACRDHEVKMEGLKGERRELVKVKRRFRQACKADIAKFCKDADMQKGGIAKCIYTHEKEVSATCRGWIKADREEISNTK